MMDLDYSGELNKISCPVLVVCGEKDSANKKASIELAERLAHAKLCMVKEAGHEVNVDTPEQLAKVLNGFAGDRN